MVVASTGAGNQGTRSSFASRACSQPTSKAGIHADTLLFSSFTLFSLSCRHFALISRTRTFLSPPSRLPLTHCQRAPSDRSETNFFTGEPLRALSTLSYSENVDLQRSAALAFAEITEKVSPARTRPRAAPGRNTELTTNHLLRTRSCAGRSRGLTGNS